MRFTCPACAKSYRLTRERLGASGQAKIRCPNCKAVVRVKATDGERLETTLEKAGNDEVLPQVNKPEDPVWHVAVNKQPQGPLSIGALSEMLANGQISDESLAWKKGLGQWRKIAELPELAQQLLGDETSTATLKTAAAPLPSGAQAAPPLSPGRAPSGERPAVPGARAQARKEKKRTAARERGMTEEQIAQAEARTLRPEQQVKAGGAGTLPGSRKHARQMSAAPADAPVLDEDTQRPPAVEMADEAQAASAFFEEPPPVNPQADHRAGFFETGEQMEAIALELPDPERHKPTKEEYQNLLQQYSVMFRLDRRSKRQKAGIAVVLVTLLVGVCAFGVVLYMQGKQRQALMNDAKTILAVFTLSYQSSVTVNLSEEAEQESKEFGDKTANAGGQKTKTSSGLAEQLRSKVRRERIASQRRAKRYTKKKKKKTKTSSGLAEQLRSKVRRERIASQRRAKRYTKKKKKKFKNIGISKAELAALQAQARGETVLRDKFGRAVKKVGIDTRREPSRAVLMGLCRGGIGTMKSCAKSVANKRPFKAKLFVSREGGVSRVEARVDGKAHAALSSCIASKMKNKRVGQLTRPASIVCAGN